MVIQQGKTNMPWKIQGKGKICSLKCFHLIWFFLRCPIIKGKPEIYLLEEESQKKQVEEGSWNEIICLFVLVHVVLEYHFSKSRTSLIQIRREQEQKVGNFIRRRIQKHCIGKTEKKFGQVGMRIDYFYVCNFHVIVLGLPYLL